MSPFLQTHAASIKAYTGQPAFPWKMTWDELRYASDPRIMQCKARFGTQGFSRASVTQLFKDAITNPSLREAAILGALLWGGISTSGKNGDRLLILLCFRGPPTFQTVFDICYSVLNGGPSSSPLRKAYPFFENGGPARLPEVGPAYFTKLIYFMGAALGRYPAPLILDKWSGNAYGMLLLDQGSLGKFQKMARVSGLDEKNRVLPIRVNSQVYEHYVADMDLWANQVECTADMLEAWLFGQDLKTKNGKAKNNPRLLVWNELLARLKQHGLHP